MIQLISDFKDKLVAAAPNATVRPALGKDKAFPAVVYSVRGGMRDSYYVDSFGIRKTEFTATIYSTRYETVQELKSQLVSAFHGFSGTMGSSTVNSITVTNILDGFDTNMETIHRSTITMDLVD